MSIDYRQNKSTITLDCTVQVLRIKQCAFKKTRSATTTGYKKQNQV